MNFTTPFNFKSFEVKEDYSHKLKNFQLVRPLSLEQRINRFLAAGQDLKKLAGLGVFDFNECQPIDDEADDVTRDPDFDLIDAATFNRDAVLRLQSSESAINESGLEPVQKSQNEEKQPEQPEKTEQVESSQGL